MTYERCCPTCAGTGVVDPKENNDYDSCPDCNYGDGPTGYAPGFSPTPLSTKDAEIGYAMVEKMGRDAHGNPADRDAMLIFADWLDDKGWYDNANRWRAYHQRLTKEATDV